MQGHGQLNKPELSWMRENVNYGRFATLTTLGMPEQSRSNG